MEVSTLIPILEITVLCAIAVEIYALYIHGRLEHRLDEHVLETEQKLTKFDVHVSLLDERMNRLAEYLARLDELLKQLDSCIAAYQSVSRTSETVSN